MQTIGFKLITHRASRYLLLKNKQVSILINIYFGIRISPDIFKKISVNIQTQILTRLSDTVQASMPVVDFYALTAQ